MQVEMKDIVKIPVTQKLLEMFATAQSAGGDALRAAVSRSNLEKMAQQRPSGLVLAGAQVLDRIQNGDATVMQQVAAPTPQQQMEAAQRQQIEMMFSIGIVNLIEIGNALQQEVERHCGNKE